jgi:hypothetical protein
MFDNCCLLQPGQPKSDNCSADVATAQLLSLQTDSADWHCPPGPEIAASTTIYVEKL